MWLPSWITIHSVWVVSLLWQGWTSIFLLGSVLRQNWFGAAVHHCPSVLVSWRNPQNRPWLGRVFDHLFEQFPLFLIMVAWLVNGIQLSANTRTMVAAPTLSEDKGLRVVGRVGLVSLVALSLGQVQYLSGTRPSKWWINRPATVAVSAVAVSILDMGCSASGRQLECFHDPVLWGLGAVLAGIFATSVGGTLLHFGALVWDHSASFGLRHVQGAKEEGGSARKPKRARQSPSLAASQSSATSSTSHPVVVCTCNPVRVNPLTPYSAPTTPTSSRQRCQLVQPSLPLVLPAAKNSNADDRGADGRETTVQLSSSSNSTSTKSPSLASTKRHRRSVFFSKGRLQRLRFALSAWAMGGLVGLRLVLLAVRVPRAGDPQFQAVEWAQRAQDLTVAYPWATCGIAGYCSWEAILTLAVCVGVTIRWHLPGLPIEQRHRRRLSSCSDRRRLSSVESIQLDPLSRPKANSVSMLGSFSAGRVSSVSMEVLPGATSPEFRSSSRILLRPNEETVEFGSGSPMPAGQRIMIEALLWVIFCARLSNRPGRLPNELEEFDCLGWNAIVTGPRGSVATIYPSPRTTQEPKWDIVGIVNLVLEMANADA